MDTRVGPVVTADEICHAAAAFLEAWLPQALASISDTGGRTIKAPSSYQQVPTQDAILAAEQQLPAVGFFSSGLADAPFRDESGDWQMTWRVTAAGYVRAGSFTDTQWEARTLGALIRAILSQNTTWGGTVASVVPVAETYDLIDSNASRTLAGVAVEFDVTVQQAFSDIPAAPYGPTYTVLTTDAETEVEHPALA